MTSRPEMEAILEAILFVATDPVPRDRLLEVFDEEERAAAELALAAVVERHARQDGRGLMLEEVGGGLRLVTRPDLHGWLRRFYEAAGATKLSMAALETLAIVAYRQPVTAPEVEALRGVSPAGVLKTLLERRLIRITGRKPVVGKPFLYATTREFLMHFGLRDLEELPPLEEFEETFGEGGVPVEVGGADATADREERILRQAAELEEAAAGQSAEPLELEPR